MLRIEARRSALPWIAVVTGLAAAVTQPATATPLVVSRAAVASAAAEPASTGDRAIFEPVAPVRLLDTRKAGPAIGAKAERLLQVSGVAGVPADALAVVVNVTAVLPTASGYLTVYPTGVTPRPTASTVNFLAKQVVANLATVQLGDGGRVSIYNALNATTGGTHVVMDLAGYYRSHAHDDRYLLKSEAQGRTAPGAFTCVTGVLKSVAADGAPTCVSTPASAEYFAGFGLTLTDGVFAAEQGRNAPNAFTCTVGSYLQAVAANGAPTCAADKDTDTDTKYTAGSGLALSGTTFSAEQGRSAAGAFTCSIGSYLQAVAANGAPTCVADSDTKYTAGSGLALSGTTFSAEQGRSAPNAFFCESGTYLRAASATGAPTCATDTGVQFTTGLGLLLSNGVLSAEQGRSAVNAFTCQVGSYLRVVAQNGAPTCSPDADTDTTYEPGFGLYLDGNVFAAEQGRSAKNAFFCEEGSYLREVAADGTPTCATDAVGPTYTAGSGINIVGGAISAHQSRTATNAFACPAGEALRIVGADGAPTCTTAGYAAGPGLSLNGTTFSSAYGATVVPIRGDGTPTENGTLLRNTMNGLPFPAPEKPYVLALAPGTYDLGGTSLTMKPYVSVVGAGRGFTTITGARVSQSGGLVNLGDGTTLAGVTVRNMVPAGTSFVTAIMSNGANAARLFDVHGYASQEGGEAYGLLVFAGGLVTVENSQFTALNPTAIGTGIYSISNSVVRARNVEVGIGAVGGWALHAYNNGRIEFADGYANGPVRKGTPDSTVHVAHSKVDGIVNGGVLCFGVHTSAMTAATCT